MTSLLKALSSLEGECPLSLCGWTCVECQIPQYSNTAKDSGFGIRAMQVQYVLTTLELNIASVPTSGHPLKGMN